MSRSPDRSRPPAAELASRFRPPPFVRKGLGEGLELFAAPREGSPLVEIELLLPAGGDRNPLDRPGLSLLSASLLDEGTARRTGIELAMSLESRGISLSTAVEWDCARVAVSALGEHLDTALDALAEVVLEPSFPEAEVERLRRQTLTEIDRRPEQPPRLAARAFASALYAGTPFGELLQGTAESVKTIERAEIVEFHARHCRPTGSRLVIGGAIEADDVARRAKSRFVGWRGIAPASPADRPAKQRGLRVRIVDLPDAAQTEIRIGHLGVPRAHPDRSRLAVLNSLLGGKFSSRLNLNLRERHGFTYGVSSQFVDRRGAGPFVVAASVAHAAAGAAVGETLTELRRLREQPVEPHELAETRSYLLGVYPYTFQTVAGHVARLADLALHDLPDDHLERSLAEIAATTIADLQRLAIEHLHPDDAIVVAVGPAATLIPQLESLGPVEVSPAA